jgi:hypothetical protein
MNDDTKLKQLKWITNNYNIDNYDHDLVYSNITNFNNNLKTILTSLGTYSITDIVKTSDINNDGLPYSIVYGTYNTNLGFMIILDSTGNVIQTLTKYTSNVNIGIIYALNVSEDGTLYMIEKSVETSNKRFVMLNNIVTKLASESQFYIKIRQSYNLPSQINNANISKIVKAIGQAKYLIGGTIPVNYGGTNYTTPMVTELTINVGSSNAWVDYIGSPYHLLNEGTVYRNVILDDIWANWTNDSIDFVIIGHVSNIPNYLAKYYYENGQIYFTSISTYITGAEHVWSNNCKIINKNLAYYGLIWDTSYTNTAQSEFLKLNMSTGTDYAEELGSSTYEFDYNLKDYCKVQILNINNEIFFLNVGFGLYDSVNGYPVSYVLGKLREDSQYYTAVISSKNMYISPGLNVEAPAFSMLNINKQFNLYNFNLLIDNKVYNCNQVYNSNDYNGTPVNNAILSLKPYSSNLYNNDRIVFSRNLYNLTKNNNTITATLDIPFQYINNIEITPKSLLSYANNEMIADVNPFTKNIYEEILLNFFNTLQIVNKNNISNITYNNNGANRLTNAFINEATEDKYQNSMIKYYRITYEDNTFKDMEISTSSFNPTTKIGTYEFYIGVPYDKKIKNIQFISKDKLTSYITIECSCWVLGSIRKIYQEITIE